MVVDERCHQDAPFTLLRCTAHQHVGGQCITVSNADTGQKLCSSCPRMGTKQGGSAADGPWSCIDRDCSEFCVRVRICVCCWVAVMWARSLICSGVHPFGSNRYSPCSGCTHWSRSPTWTSFLSGCSHLSQGKRASCWQFSLRTAAPRLRRERLCRTTSGVRLASKSCCGSIVERVCGSMLYCGSTWWTAPPEA